MDHTVEPLESESSSSDLEMESLWITKDSGSSVDGVEPCNGNNFMEDAYKEVC